MPHMNAMILAAGRGERMRPLTDHRPKPLLQVGGKPLLQWHLEALAESGFESVVINIAYLGTQIAQFVGDGSRWGLRVRISKEPEGALETAGGIAQARPWTDRNDQAQDSLFLVINADIWTDWPRAQAFEIAREMRSTDSLAHIVLVDNPPHHPQGDFELAADGSPRPLLQEGPRDDAPVIASRDNPNTVIARSAQRDVAIRPSLTFSGIGIYKRALFSSIRPGQRAALAPLLRQAMATGQCTAIHYRGKWSDIGTPERLNDINSALSEPKSLSEPK
jgi:N-acetyl-alpha-D-muramate 1-phosphate uridylyltransferase